MAVAMTADDCGRAWQQWQQNDEHDIIVAMAADDCGVAADVNSSNQPIRHGYQILASSRVCEVLHNEF